MPEHYDRHTIDISKNNGDPVEHPPHYMSHPSGVECIQVAEFMSFNLGSCLKYLWRCDLKNNAIQDLEKARWYLDREINKRKNTTKG